MQQSTNELKHSVGSLTQHLSRVNISSLTSQHRPNSRSPTPRRQHTQHAQCNVTDKYVIETTHDELMCSYCNSLGHVYENCRLREINTQQTYIPHDQQTRGRPMQRQFYASRHYTQPRASYYNAYGHPHPTQQQQTNQYYNQRCQRYNSNNTQLHSSQNFELGPRCIHVDLLSYANIPIKQIKLTIIVYIIILIENTEIIAIIIIHMNVDIMAIVIDTVADLQTHLKTIIVIM